MGGGSTCCRTNSLVLSLVLIIIGAAGTAQAYACYTVNNRPTAYSNDNYATLFPLDETGLSGRFTGYWSNTTGLGEITFQLWFITYGGGKFTLSLLAIRNPNDMWQLLRPEVLWTANRESYFGDGATLDLGSDGNLILRDNATVVWSSGTAGKGVANMCISNLGNLYLENAAEEIVWQIFDFPSNTISVQVAFKPGHRLTSWASSTDSRRGLYTLSMESDRLALYYKTETYWSFAAAPDRQNHDELFAAVCWQSNGVMSLDIQNNASIIDDAQGFLTANACRDSTPLNRFKLLGNGQNFSYGIFLEITLVGDLQVNVWNDTGKYWYPAYKLSSNSTCFLPNKCGEYGVCNTTDGQCTRMCPRTFRYEGGICNATRPMLDDPCLQSYSYEFVTLPNVDYFSSNFTAHRNAASDVDCRSSCETNCNCTAAFYKTGSCFQTHEPVQTMKTGEYTAFLKVAKGDGNISATGLPDEDSERDNQVLRVALPVLTPTLVLLLAALSWICWKRSTNDGEPSDKEDEELEMTLRDYMPRRFTYKKLEQVTQGWSKCLGQGGYGTVYKGSLEEGAEVAVKKLQGSNQTSPDFFAELASLARTNHLNLVKFLGFCAEGPRKRLLVYEFVPNGSLEKWIFGGGEDALDVSSQGKDDTGLSWDLKFRIAVGTAQGLCYLHEECAEKIIHLDLKPENILLDVGFVPKITDFGLSKLMNRELTYMQITSMRGTPGYLAPEYLQIGTITEKSDVFSYGVLLLEIVTGCRNKFLTTEFLGSFSFRGTSSQQSAMKPSRSKRSFHDYYQGAAAEKLTTVAYLCVQDDPELRPSMSTVVKMLEGLIELPESPPAANLHFFLGYRSTMKLPVSSKTPSTSSVL